jgi:preprotein translocase subunit SecA
MKNFYDSNLKRSFLLALASAIASSPRDKPSRRSVGEAACTAKPVQAKQFSSLGRNDPCHCGSGRKFKKCCLSPAQGPTPAPTPLEG